jgi:hypothetical protein
LQAFDDAHPRILGALLDALAGALRMVEQTTLAELPRMADFVIWGTAAESALEWEAGSVVRAYDANRETAHGLALESSAIALGVLAVAVNGFEGNATELLGRLNQQTPDAMRAPGWPKTAKKLSSDLKRLAPNLRAQGVVVEWDRNSKKRLIRLHTVTTVTTVTASGGRATVNTAEVLDPPF